MNSRVLSKLGPARVSIICKFVLKLGHENAIRLYIVSNESKFANSTLSQHAHSFRFFQTERRCLWIKFLCVRSRSYRSTGIWLDFCALGLVAKRRGSMKIVNLELMQRLHNKP